MRTGAVTGRAQDSQSGPPTPGHPQMKVRQASPPPTGWLRDDGWGPPPLPSSGSRRPGVAFGSFALHGPPPQEEGEAPGAWGQAQSEGAPGGDPVSPCSWDGRPAAAAFPEMVVGGGGGRLRPHPLGPRRLQSPGLSQGRRSPRLGRLFVSAPRLGQAELGVPYATWCRKRVPRAGRAVRRREGPAPESPTSTVRVQAPSWAPSPGLRGPWVRAEVP